MCWCVCARVCAKDQCPHEYVQASYATAFHSNRDGLLSSASRARCRVSCAAAGPQHWQRTLTGTLPLKVALCGCTHRRYRRGKGARNDVEVEIGRKEYRISMELWALNCFTPLVNGIADFESPSRSRSALTQLTAGSCR